MFPCTKCGLCCQNISRIKELQNYDLGNGVCKYFDNNMNSCMIYDKRPNICQVDKMFEIEYHKQYTKDKFYLINANACNELQQQYQLDKKYKVILGE